MRAEIEAIANKYNLTDYIVIRVIHVGETVILNLFGYYFTVTAHKTEDSYYHSNWDNCVGMRSWPCGEVDIGNDHQYGAHIVEIDRDPLCNGHYWRGKSVGYDFVSVIGPKFTEWNSRAYIIIAIIVIP